MFPSGARDVPPLDVRWRPERAAVAWLIALLLIAYWNSFAGAFLLDDVSDIVDNGQLRRLWPLRPSLWGTARPVVDASLALNYAAGGLRVWGYHAVNLAIHLAAALTLFGIVRRTLLTEPLRARYAPAATWLAWAIATLWAVHPLQTESVTYVIQRAESLMGLCLLLSLYSVLRSATSSRPLRWKLAAVVSCAVGTGTKPTMAIAPVAILLYDRAFLARSFRDIARRRADVYLGLAATWSLLAALLVRFPDSMAGFGLNKVGPVRYAITQPGVILHYLRLTLDPQPLIFDYHWLFARGVSEWLPASLMLGSLGLATGWACRRHPRIGFLGVWWWLTLAPTSSIIPLADAAFEHRVYLPLIAVISLVVLGAYALLIWLPCARSLRTALIISALLAALAALEGLTIRRNQDYRSTLAVWQETVKWRPTNPRARENLGIALAQAGRVDDAVIQLSAAIDLAPEDPDPHYNLGVARSRQGRTQDALVEYATALRLRPTDDQARNALGDVLLRNGAAADAAALFTQALVLKPHDAQAHYNLATTLAHAQRFADAAWEYTEALRLRPDYPEAHNNLGNVLVAQGRIAEAAIHFSEALRLQPHFREARTNLQAVLTRTGLAFDAPDAADKH